jgi:tetratricopeptide (TPR) repeat protein
MRIAVIISLVFVLASCMHNEVESTVSIERLRVRAERHHRAHEFEQSIELYEELARVIPLSQSDNYRLGQAYYFTEQYEKADLTFAKIQAKSPKAGVSLLWRARSKAAIDSTAINGLALQHYKELVDDPSIESRTRADVHEACMYLSYYYFQRNDYAQVKAYLKKLIALYSDDDPVVEDVRSLLMLVEQKK